MRRRRITGNSNVAIQTGTTYIFDSMTTAIPTAKLGFRPRPEWRNWPWAIATTTDNRKQQYRRFVLQYCNFWYSTIAAVV